MLKETCSRPIAGRAIHKFKHQYSWVCSSNSSRNRDISTRDLRAAIHPVQILYIHQNSTNGGVSGFTCDLLMAPSFAVGGEGRVGG